ncbi:MAG: hypothetical protein V1646_03405 [bacterium]
MKRVQILSLSILALGLFSPCVNAAVVQPDDETLTWGELMLEMRQDKDLKQEVSNWINKELSSKKSYAKPETREVLFEKLISGIIQDTITAHLLANIIKQKTELKAGTVLLNPEDTSISKNNSTDSIESYIRKNLAQFCKTWSILTNRKIETSKKAPVEFLKSFIIPALKDRLALIIKMADEILDNQGISDGYKKIYSHVYKNVPKQDKAKEGVIADTAQDLAKIYAGYYYETKNPETVVPSDVLHMFSFSLLRDLYLPTVRLRVASTLPTDKTKITSPKRKAPTKREARSKKRRVRDN